MDLDILETEKKATLYPLSDLKTVEEINEWIFRNTLHYIDGRRLEICSGCGEISSFFVKNKIDLHLSDSNKNNLEILAQRYEGNDFVRSIQSIDYQHPNFKAIYTSLLERFDVVIKVNILTGLPATEAMIKNVKLLLKKDGLLIILVPVFTSLYDNSVKGWEAFKSHNRKSLKYLLGNDITIVKTRFFTLPNKVESTTFVQSGLSVIVVAQRKY